MLAAVVTGTLALAACAGASERVSSPTVDETRAPDSVAAGDDFSEAEDTEFEIAVSAEVSQDTAIDTEAGAVADEPSTATEQPVATQAEPPDEAEAIEAAAPARPALGGRALAADVQPAAQFENNPFPDLLVEDIGKNAQANIKNILPSDRPVLLWAWAPH